MKIITEAQKDRLIYWEYNGADAYGQPIYAAPVQMTCRWDECIKQVFTSDGSPVFSSIELITQKRLKPKSIVKKGKLSNNIDQAVPRNNNDVYEVIGVEETPMLKTRSVTLFEAYA
jgi:hypothetical protein